MGVDDRERITGSDSGSDFIASVVGWSSNITTPHGKRVSLRSGLEKELLGHVLPQ